MRWLLTLAFVLIVAEALLLATLAYALRSILASHHSALHLLATQHPDIKKELLQIIEER